ILRIQKLKSFADVGGSLSHNYRNRETLNADSDRTHLNEHELDTNEKCMTAIRDRIPEKRRKDAVLCIEHLITASPEWDGWGTEKETAFFEKSKKWLEEKYG
ncbi:plasmid recombination protein, partial [Klebsiella pneumoniae]|uniref:plasmid recombination protein n=1 Tax=Klebsiella pneumoniae TaxID=573 RepID=UPI00190F19F5